MAAVAEETPQNLTKDDTSKENVVDNTDDTAAAVDNAKVTDSNSSPSKDVSPVKESAAKDNAVKGTPPKSSPAKDTPNNKNRSPVPTDTTQDEKKDSDKSKDNDKTNDTTEGTPVVGGKRKRTAVQAYTPIDFTAGEKKELEFNVGKGVPLGEISYITEMMGRRNAEHFTLLHRLCFGRNGDKTVRKKNLRKFNGFDFDADSPHFEHKVKQLTKCKKADRVQVIELLGLKKSATITEVISFLLSPVDNGKHVTSSRDKARKTPQRASSRKSTTPRKTAKLVENSDLSMSESGEDSSNESDEYVPSRAAKKPRKSKTPKKTPTRSPPKRAAAKKTKKYTEEDESEGEEEEEKEEEEQEKKSADNSESDSELEKTVKEVVGSIDLEEVSMNDALKKVYEKYPDKDISDKKDKIKNWIRDMI